jgi:hypothetical protein
MHVVLNTSYFFVTPYCVWIMTYLETFMTKISCISTVLILCFQRSLPWKTPLLTFLYVSAKIFNIRLFQFLQLCIWSWLLTTGCTPKETCHCFHHFLNEKRHTCTFGLKLWNQIFYLYVHIYGTQRTKLIVLLWTTRGSLNRHMKTKERRMVQEILMTLAILLLVRTGENQDTLCQNLDPQSRFKAATSWICLMFYCCRERPVINRFGYCCRRMLHS